MIMLTVAILSSIGLQSTTIFAKLYLIAIANSTLALLDYSTPLQKYVYHVIALFLLLWKFSYYVIVEQEKERKIMCSQVRE